MNRAEEYRKRKERTPDLTAEITLPSGAVFKCRRPPLEVWIAAGRVPQSFLLKMQKAEKGDGGAVVLTDEETVSTINFVRQALTYAVVEPRLVVDATGNDDLDPADLDIEDFHFLTSWILSGCPGVPVKTKEGETSIDNLARFRQKRTGSTRLPQPDGEAVGNEAKPVAKAR